MLPYHPNSEALLPPPALPPLPTEPVFPSPGSDADLLFVLTFFALFFFSLPASVCSFLDFDTLDFGRTDALDVFAKTFFFIAFGVGAVFVTGVAARFGIDTGFGVGCGVDQSISLFA